MPFLGKVGENLGGISTGITPFVHIFPCHKSKELTASLVTIFKSAHLWLNLEGSELKSLGRNKTSWDKITITMWEK